MDADALSDTLKELAAGDPGALERILPIVYRELRSLAAGYLKGERAGHTLQPTALAHEAYLRLVGRQIAWQGRNHFLAVAARAMRAILVDHARRRNAEKRGGGEAPVTLDTDMIAANSRPVAFDDLDRALTELARMSARQAQVVELRYFGGLTVEEVAEVLGVAPATVKRDWATARAWLFRELSRSEGAEE